LSITQAEALYRLQEIDLILVQTQKRLIEIDTALGERGTVTAAEGEVQAAQTHLKPLQTRSRNLEFEIQSNTTKMRQADETLYGGRVRNPKELQDLQNEIQSLKKRNMELEDSLLEFMVEVEAGEATLAARQAALKAALAAWEAEHVHLLDEQAKLKQGQPDVLKRRQQALVDVSPDSLKMYQTLKPRKHNQPVALLVNQSCSFCRVEQDLAIIKDTRAGQKLTTCLSCGRILAYRSG
jgi:predicted  nucleic acid-binding Zn-ribbon protein